MTLPVRSYSELPVNQGEFPDTQKRKEGGMGKRRERDMDGEEGVRKKKEGKWGWGGGSVGKYLLPEPECLSVGHQHSSKKLS